MGNQKLKWTVEEEEALIAGVAKYGPGKWKIILRDPDFAPRLTHRSNIDLKDKWRNLGVSGGSRLKGAALICAPAASSVHIGSSEPAIDGPSTSSLRVKNDPTYESMILEALAASKNEKGTDVNAIINFHEQRQKVQPKFKSLLGSTLTRLVQQGKVEKAENCYKISSSARGTKTPTPKQRGTKLRRVNNVSSPASYEYVEEAALSAAYKVAEAENKSFLAAEAVREAEAVMKMAEDTDLMLQLSEEIHKKCCQGGIILLA